MVSDVARRTHAAAHQSTEHNAANVRADRAQGTSKVEVAAAASTRIDGGGGESAHLDLGLGGGQHTAMLGLLPNTTAAGGLCPAALASRERAHGRTERRGELSGRQAQRMERRRGETGVGRRAGKLAGGVRVTASSTARR
nr:unnamed protein product [Digitaria exilis]